MIRNIVFDAGNVLIRTDFSKMLAQTSPDLEVQKKIWDFYFPDRWQEYDRGCTSREALMQMASEAFPQLKEAFASWWEHWFSALFLDEKAETLVKKTREAGYHVYLLSNMPEDVYEFLQKQKFFDLFDGVLASCHVHLLKPAPEIFTYFFAQEHLDPKECFFIDDRAENIAAAGKLGMQGAVLENMDDLETLLEKFGILKS